MHFVRWSIFYLARFAVFLLLASPLPVAAHGSLHSQIEDLTAQIARSPGKPELYIHRGDLYRQHEEPKSAIKDFVQALRLEPAADAARLGLAKAFFELGRNREARDELNELVTRQPGLAEAFLWRGRVLRALKTPRPAVSDYRRAIELGSDSGPDIYIEAAEACEEGRLHSEALSLLDAGMHALGELAALELKAVDLEVAQKHYEGALERLDRRLARVSRKEFLLVRRAEILEEAGRPVESVKAYHAARLAIHGLAPEQRSVPAVTRLDDQISVAIQRLAKHASL